MVYGIRFATEWIIKCGYVKDGKIIELEIAVFPGYAFIDVFEIYSIN